MSSIFTKIVQGEIPCYKIAENHQFLAFLDIRPVAPGHTLVIPKEEVDYIFDLDDSAFAALHLFAKRVAVALRAAVPCTRIATAVVGLEVPHAHIHLVPLTPGMTFIDFAAPRPEFSPEEMQSIAEQIRQQLLS
jgi:histidine triad (HIT) family protein